MSFEKFTPKRGRTPVKKPPQAKILKGGLISFNSEAYQEYMKGATHVELFYDSARKRIGLRPKKYRTKSGFKLRAVGKNKSTYRINAKQLVQHYGIKPAGKTAVTPSWNNSESLLELSL